MPIVNLAHPWRRSIRWVADDGALRRYSGGQRVFRDAKWRWSNVPLPEMHILPLAAAMVLHFAALTWQLLPNQWLGHVIG